MPFFGPRVWIFLIFGSFFGFQTCPAGYMIQFFMQNPNLQSELTSSLTLRRKLRKTNLRESRLLIVRFLIVCPTHFRHISDKCSTHFRHISDTFSTHFRHILFDVFEIFQVFPRFFLGFSQVFPRLFLGFSQLFRRFFLGFS